MYFIALYLLIDTIGKSAKHHQKWSSKVFSKNKQPLSYYYYDAQQFQQLFRDQILKFGISNKLKYQIRIFRNSGVNIN